MCNKDDLNEVLSKFSISIKEIFHEKLKAIILFGSYARGDYDNESDIDIMVLVDIEKMDIKNYRNEIVMLTSKLGMDYNVVLAPIIQNFSEFNRFKETSGFFRNVQNEGVLISAWQR